MTICQFTGKMPLSTACQECSLLYEVCIPVCASDGGALNHECSIEYFCPECQAVCQNKELINL